MTVIDWLMDADPAIRWQVMRDLTHAPADAVAAERAKVATEGWGAQLLALQRDDGSWGGGALFPEWTGTTPTLVVLHSMGVDPASDVAQAAIAKVAEHVRWEHAGQRYFDGEVEPCINGKAVMIGAYFGVDVHGIVERLLAEQLSDGGWNCEVENGATVSSFGTTIEVLDGLLEYERAMGGSGAVAAARARAHEYLLERGLIRRKSTGEVIDPTFTEFAFPTRWHYDVLRGLDYLRDARTTPDERAGEAIELVESKRDADGRWALDHTWPGETYFPLDDGDGRPSRWNTLRALRVLDWYRPPAIDRGATA